jgi:hypothetical protein
LDRVSEKREEAGSSLRSEWKDKKKDKDKADSLREWKKEKQEQSICGLSSATLLSQGGAYGLSGWRTGLSSVRAFDVSAWGLLGAAGSVGGWAVL